MAEGNGNGPTTIIAFQSVTAKFVRVILTADAPDAPAWSIQNFKVYGLRR